jgi:outer membrane protein
MTKLVLGTALAALALALPAAAPAQRLQPAVVAVVDTGRIFEECTACRAAQATLQTQLQQVQQRAEQLRTPLQTEGQSLQTAINALNGKQPDAALQQRIQSLQTRQNQANQELAGREQSLRSTQAHVAQQINQRLQPIINQVMQTRGATVVVDRGATLAVSPTIDVTNDVLAQLNQQLPSVSVTPLPQQQQQQPTGR